MIQCRDCNPLSQVYMTTNADRTDNRIMNPNSGITTCSACPWALGK